MHIIPLIKRRSSIQQAFFISINYFYIILLQYPNEEIQFDIFMVLL